MRAPHAQRGFTFIEMIVTLVLTTIVMGFVAMFVGTPIQAYFAQTRRASLSDSAEAITRNISADVRTALPNSTRVGANGSIIVLEVLTTVDVLRYRQANEVSDPTRELDFVAADNLFSTLGRRLNPTLPFSYLVVNNQGQPGADAYALANVITPAVPANVVASAVAGESTVTLVPAFKFTWPATYTASPSHSVFLVSGPVAYLCDVGSQTLQRYVGYTIANNISARDSDAELMGAGATRSVIARNVTACQITRAAATAYRGDLVTLRIALTDSGETMPMFFQAAVERRP